MQLRDYPSFVLQFVPGSIGQKFRHILNKRSIEPTKKIFLKIIEQLTADSVALDLGANVGKNTVILASKAGRVYAFEPDPWSFDQLKKNVSDYRNVRPIQAAAGTANGSVDMYRKANFDDDPTIASLGTSTYATKDDIDSGEKISAQQVDIINFISNLNRDVEIIKMDVEGAEVPILEMLLASPISERVHHIFVETHEMRIPELFERTKALRNKVRKIQRPKVYMNWR